MKYALYTIIAGETYKRLSNITHKYMKLYSENISADFIVDEQRLPSSSYFDLMKWMTTAKFKIRDLLRDYDRVLYVDADILIFPNSPNIFNIVPTNKFGIFEEGYIARGNFLQFSSYVKAYNSILKEMKLPQPNIDRSSNYYNAGVFLASKETDIFDLPVSEKIYNIKWADQNHINYLLGSKGTDVFKLPIEFNRMTSWGSSKIDNILKSYFIHYSVTRMERRIQMINTHLNNYNKKYNTNYTT